MGNTYTYINDDTIPKPVNKYLNKYCQCNTLAMGMYSGELYKTTKEEILKMGIDKLPINIMEQVLEESWGRKSDFRDIGPTNHGMGSFEILKIWNKEGVYDKLKELDKNEMYDCNHLKRYGDHILVDICGEDSMIAVIIVGNEL